MKLEVRAAGQDLPLETGPGHPAAEDRHDAALPGCARADDDGRRDLGLDRADEVEPGRRVFGHAPPQRFSGFKPSISRASAGEAGSRPSSFMMRTERATSISL